MCTRSKNKANAKKTSLFVLKSISILAGSINLSVHSTSIVFFIILYRNRYTYDTRTDYTLYDFHYCAVMIQSVPDALVVAKRIRMYRFRRYCRVTYSVYFHGVVCIITRTNQTRHGVNGSE